MKNGVRLQYRAENIINSKKSYEKLDAHTGDMTLGNLFGDAQSSSFVLKEVDFVVLC